MKKLTKTLINNLRWTAAHKDRELALYPKDAQMLLDALQPLPDNVVNRSERRGQARGTGADCESDLRASRTSDRTRRRVRRI